MWQAPATCGRPHLLRPERGGQVGNRGGVRSGRPEGNAAHFLDRSPTAGAQDPAAQVKQGAPSDVPTGSPRSVWPGTVREITVVEL
ncbi:hypothetical protein ACIA8F_09095 [Streptomyces sp. NPDC051563]|uniref:hypothetical protein n=1 Tax=Streptomyces sp. NPDC051563 TaxID=3365659 RepID=UPI0037AE1F2C